MPDPIAASTIAAQAFRFMELRPIGAFADDSPEAADAREQYLPALKLCLELDDWSFARKLVRLPPVLLSDGEIADPDMAGIYQLPGDCVALRRVYPDDVAYRADERYLRAGPVDGLTIRYTRLIEDESDLPSTFATAVSLQLAIRLAPMWVSSRTKRATLQDDFQAALEMAGLPQRTSASHGRLDGRPAQPDWACEAPR